MQFFKKFFTNKNKNFDKDVSSLEFDKSTLDTDELFVVNYKEKGGKFFYPEGIDQLTEQLVALLKLVGIQNYIVIERSYYHFLKKIKIPVTDKMDKKGILLSGCEYLLAEEGSILMTSKQIKNFRNTDLPKKRVFITTSDQIVKNRQKALEEINKKYNNYPSNIQSISHYKDSLDDLLGASWHETYLFLIEK